MRQGVLKWLKRLQERYLAISCEKSEKNDGQEERNQFHGTVAQWTTRLTTNQESAGSNSARLESIFLEDRLYVISEWSHFLATQKVIWYSK